MKISMDPGRVYADDTPTGAGYEGSSSDLEAGSSGGVGASSEAIGSGAESSGVGSSGGGEAGGSGVSGAISLSTEELDARIERGVLGAVRKLQEQVAASGPAVGSTLIRRAPEAAYDPARESLSLLKESTKMNTEALTLYPDLPEEYRARIESQLEQISPDQIAAFRRSGLHKTIANAVMAEAINDGKYTPKRFIQGTTPHREPAGGGVSSLNPGDPLKFAYHQEVDELEALLGRGLNSTQRTKLKLTPQEREAAYGSR